MFIRYLQQIRKSVLSLMGRCILLYLIAAGILFFSVDHQKVVRRTLDYFKGVPNELLSFARGQKPLDDYTFRQGVRYYQNAARLMPRSPLIDNALGFCYFHLGQEKKAIQHYEKAVSIDASLFGLLYNLGYLYYHSGQYQKAIAACEQAIAINPIGAFQGKNIIAPNPTMNKSLSGLQELQAYQGYHQCVEWMILSHRELQDYQAMMLAARIGIEIVGQKNQLFYYYAGLASYELGDYQNSVIFFNMSLRNNPHFAQPYDYLVRSFQKLNQTKLAEAVLRAKEQIQTPSSDVDSPGWKVHNPLYYYVPVFSILTEQGRVYWM